MKTTSVAAARAGGKTAGSLVIVTLNTGKGAGDYRQRLILMGDGLYALAPDVVLLQEVIVAPAVGADTGMALAERLGFFHLHHPARAKRRTVLGHRVFSTSGLSVLSRWPILRARAIALPTDPRDGERLAQMVSVGTPHGLVTVVNIHLTHLAGADPLRFCQLSRVVDALAGWPDRQVAIVGGDFNCEPQSQPLGWLQTATGFTARSAWEAAGGPQPTLTTADGQHAGRRCIDHLFLLKQSSQSAARWTAAARALDRRHAERGTFASDHFAICAKVTLTA